MGGYIGREPNFQNFARDVFTSDGTVTPLTLTYVPGSALALLVFAGGVYQRPTTDYTTSGNQLTPVVAWAPGVGITVVYLGIAGDVATPANGTIGWAQLSAIMQGIVGYMSGRRRTINGAMEIDQANAGASVTVNSTSVFYSADMLGAVGVVAAGVFSMQQLASTPPTGFKNYVRLQTSTADASPGASSSYLAYCPVEGQNLVDFALGLAGAIPFTLSFWVRSSLTGTFSGCFRNGGSTRSYPFTFPINSANTWEFKTISVAQGDITGTWATDNTAGMYVVFDLGSGSTLRSTAGTWQGGNFNGVTGAVRLISTLSATLDITGVQLEPGTTATPYERRTFSEELARCQRYFEKSYDLSVKPASITDLGEFGWTQNSATGEQWTQRFSATKRITPTITIYSPTTGVSGNVRDLSAAADAAVGAPRGIGTTGFTGVGLAGTATHVYVGHYTADARL